MGSATSPQSTRKPMDLMQEALSRLRQSPSTPVLLVGPPGAGKQHAAQALHRASCGAREDAPFVSVDCAALTRDFDRELFGQERGAEGDGEPARRGLVELANGGSLVLRDVTALPLGAQTLLLKFLDGMRLRRVGAPRELELSLRVIATASREPLELVKAGQFHENLYRRLAMFRVDVPALCQRADEIEPLARQFIAEFRARVGKDVSGLSDDARAALSGYAFPGNVRELRTVIERAVVNAGQPLLSADDLDLEHSGFRASELALRFFEVETPADGVPPSLEVIEKAYVHRVLEHTGGKRMAAAQLLGISYPTFLKRLRELGVDEGHSGPRNVSAAAVRR
jgi:two-component system, NtrC family, response regulator AtoC